MAGNDKQQPNIEQARELLSPYLDDQVSDEERGLVEEALAGSDELRADLDTLRQTVSLLQALPPVPAPRPFTLSEADVGVAAPASGGRGFFGLPVWLSGLTAAAATLVCVLALGGLFLTGQIGNVTAPAELARLNEEAASDPVQTESEALEEAAEAPPEAAPAESPAPASEEKLAAESAGEGTAVEAAEPEVGREEAQAVEAEVEVMEEAEESAPDEAIEDTLSAEVDATEVAEAEEPAAAAAMEERMPAEEETAPVEQQEQEQAESAVELYRDDEAGADAAGAVPQSLPTPTPAPLSTLEQPALAEEVRPPDDQREEPAAEEEPLAAQPASTGEVRGESLAEKSAPPPVTAEATPAENLAQEGVAPQQVEIRNQSLSIRPGAIRLEGIIEVEPGTQLQATLLRNGAPLESWMTSPVGQTVVQPDGRFTLEFEAADDNVEQDLFGIEPASYQIVISSVSGDEPVMATVFFDTFGPAPASTVEPPTATPSPPATSTAVAKAELTFEPSPFPSPSPVVTPVEVPVLTTPTIAPTQTGSIRSVTLIVVVVLVGVGILVVAGLLLWWLLKKQQR